MFIDFHPRVPNTMQRIHIENHFNLPAKMLFFTLLSLTLFCMSTSLLAQGQDSTPGERNLLVMAELLPGFYDNANQNYFDKRRKLNEGDRHIRISANISRVDAPAFGPHAFLWEYSYKSGEKQVSSYRIATLNPPTEDNGASDEEVVMRHYMRMEGEITQDELASLTPESLRRTKGCDYYFKRRAGNYEGKQRDKACKFEWEGEEVYAANTIQLSESDLWFVDHKFSTDTGERVTGVDSGEPYWLERARVFHCYADIPGVGGGRDIPFERYDGFTLHDKGDMHWFVTRDEDKRNIGVSLQSVTWHVLNENNGNFNRNSLVLYTNEKLADGSIKNHGYAFTDPASTRIGNNMKWMLVNCAMVPRDQARPTM